MRFSDDSKREIADRYSRAVSKARFAKAHQLTMATLNTWVEQFERERIAAAPEKNGNGHRNESEAANKVAHARAEEESRVFQVLQILMSMSPTGRARLAFVIRCLLDDISGEGVR